MAKETPEKTPTSEAEPEVDDAVLMTLASDIREAQGKQAAKSTPVAWTSRGTAPTP